MMLTDRMSFGRPDPSSGIFLAPARPSCHNLPQGIKAGRSPYSRTLRHEMLSMHALQTLAALALRHTVSTAAKSLPFEAGQDLVEGAVRFVVGRFVDPSQRCPRR